MANSVYEASSPTFERMQSVRSTGSSRYSRQYSKTLGSFSEADSVHSDSPRARHQDELHDVALAAGVPTGLPRPLFVTRERRARPQFASDRAGAEKLLMDLRPSKFLTGKSSKGFSPAEVMLGLSHATQLDTDLAVLEALLQIVESHGIKPDSSGTTINSGKKGQSVPTLDHIFAQAHLEKPQMMRLFLHRVSPRVLDDALAATLSVPSPKVDHVQSLVEWGANPELCQDQVLKFLSSASFENIIEALFLSPRISDQNFLNAALTRAAGSKSLFNVSMTVLRGADPNASQGEALRLLADLKSYESFVAILAHSNRPATHAVLDVISGIIATWRLDVQKPFVLALLYAGASGPRTSKLVIPFISTLDVDIISILANCHAFQHRSFPVSKLFRSALELEDHDTALLILGSNRSTSFAEYFSAEEHVLLVDSFWSAPAKIINIIAELVEKGPTGDFTSLMLLKACESKNLSHPEIEKLIALLTNAGKADVSFSNGQALLSAVGTGNGAVVELLLARRPNRKVLNAAILRADEVSEEDAIVKQYIISKLIEAGASGSSLDGQFVQAIDAGPSSMERVLLLLPATSLDFRDGAAVVKMIELRRVDILEKVFEMKKPQSSFLGIWKQVLRIFDLPGSCPYDLPYMQQSMKALHNAAKHLTPVDMILSEACRCSQADAASSLVAMLLAWGASPDYDLGSPLVSCITRSDTAALEALLHARPNKTSLRYAFEAAMALPNFKSLEVVKPILGAGIEKASVDAALPQVLAVARNYDSGLAHVLINHGASLHTAIGQTLITPALQFDLFVVEQLLPSGTSTEAIPPLEALLASYNDWKSGDGLSLPMLKLLLARCTPGSWADRIFRLTLKSLHLRGASLFETYLTSGTVFDDALLQVLTDVTDFSQERLAVVSYLLQRGARSSLVDQAFLQVVDMSFMDWTCLLNEYLIDHTIRVRAYEKSSKKAGDGPANMSAFLLQQGVRGACVDADFVRRVLADQLEGAQKLLPFITSPQVLSTALQALTEQPRLASTENQKRIITLLIDQGAPESAVLGLAWAAGRMENQPAVQLLKDVAPQIEVTKAIFQGLLQNDHALTSTRSQEILRLLAARQLDLEDAFTVTRNAAATYDPQLLQCVAGVGSSKVLYDAALEALDLSGIEWMTSQGLHFIDFLLKHGGRGRATLRMVESAARYRDLKALKLVLPACSTPSDAVDAGLATFAREENALDSPEGLSVLTHLVNHGTKDPSLASLAERAAATLNHEALEILLRCTAAAALVIPAAFRAVARMKSSRLSASELSIATILIKHGVSTEILSIAAIEATKLLDVEALRVLSSSLRFPAVTDDAMRALLLDSSLWSSDEGARILEYLIQTGISDASYELAATTIAKALNIDSLHVLFRNTTPEGLVEVAFAAMIGQGSQWLSSEGLRIAELLLSLGPAQPSVDRAFIEASRALKSDHVSLMYPCITDVSVFNAAFSAATKGSNAWLSELHLVQQLLDSGIEGDAVEHAFENAASYLHLSAMQLLATRIDRDECFSKALLAAQSNPSWRQAIEVIEFLLGRKARGGAVEQAYVAAASELDYDVVSILIGQITDKNVDCTAFEAATRSSHWLEPRHTGLIELLHSRDVTPDVVLPALTSAAKAMNVSMVELLVSNASPSMASEAFRATLDTHEWGSPQHAEIMRACIERSAHGPAVERALVRCSGMVRRDLFDMLLPNVSNDRIAVLDEAMDALLTSSSGWVFDSSALVMLQTFINYGAKSVSASEALVDAAENAAFDAVKTLALLVSDAAVYTEAFTRLTQNGDAWLDPSSLQLLSLLLAHGATGRPVNVAMLNATDQFIEGRASDGLLTLLLKSGADLNYLDGEALQLAASHGSVWLFTFLLSGRLDGLSIYMGLKQALCSQHDEHIAFQILKAVSDNPQLAEIVNVNHKSKLGEPLIFYALLHYPASTRICSLLCDLGSNPAAVTSSYAYDEDGMATPGQDQVSPSHYAILNHASDEVIDVLLEQNPDIESPLDASRANTVILAAKHNRHTVLSKLLDRRARIGQKDCYDRTAMFYAARWGNVAALTSLIKKKPTPNDGSLHEAARGLHSEAIALLLKSGHAIDYPSSKHDGRTALCELCAQCEVEGDVTDLDAALHELSKANAEPLLKCRGLTPLFYAIDNRKNPEMVVRKLIEVILWKPERLNDHGNVFEDNSLFYSASMYIRRGICKQPEYIALRVLQILEDMGVTDRFYAKERMKQPEDACGMPQHIADFDKKKWIRQNRQLEEEEDHKSRLRRTREEVSQQDQLTTRKHIQTMEEREDLALQAINHTTDTHLQQMRFRSMDHSQAIRYRDDQMSVRMDDSLMNSRQRSLMDASTRNANLDYNSRSSMQRIGYLDQEQIVKLQGAQAQQDLRLRGISAEHSLKNDQQHENLWFREANGAIDRADMEYKLQHQMDMNAQRADSSQRLEDIARNSQQRKNMLESDNRQSQLMYQEQIGDRKLYVEQGMNDLRRQNNEETHRALQSKYHAQDLDRQSQLRFKEESNREALYAIESQGRMTNEILRDKHMALQENRDNTLQHTADLGMQKIENERGMGVQKRENERMMGEVKVYNEQVMGYTKRENESMMGQVKVHNEETMGYTKRENERMMGDVKVGNEAKMGKQRVANESALGSEKARSEQKMGAAKVQTARGVGAAQAQAAYAKGVASGAGRAAGRRYH